MLIVAGSLFVPAFNVASGSIGGNSMFLNDANGPIRQFASNEDMETILAALQNIVGAPPHDHAGAFIRQLLDQLRLVGIDLVRQGHAIFLAGVIGGVAPRRNAGEQTAGGGIFPLPLHCFRRQSAALRHDFYQLFVIEWDFKAFRNLFPNRVTSAATLTP